MVAVGGYVCGGGRGDPRVPPSPYQTLPGIWSFLVWVESIVGAVFGGG